MNPFGDEDDIGGAWGAPPASKSVSDTIQDALRKEEIIKEIQAAQADLRVLLDRVDKVQGEVEKLSSGNSMLQMYIDNLTKQMVKR